MHIGSGIINITPPVNHPARVAERVAMLDHLSEGRFEFGTGRGSSTTEQAGFGINDPDLTKDMYDEAIGEFKKMWAPGTYQYDGKFFSLPERNVLPKPYVKPHPPMWVAAGTRARSRRPGRWASGVLCFTGGAPEKMAPLVEIYKNAINDAEPVGEYVNDNVAITTSFMCLEDRDEAIDWVTRSGNGYQQTLLFKYLDTFPKPPLVPGVADRDPGPDARAGDRRPEIGASIVGNPGGLRRVAAQVGGDRRRPADHGPVRQHLPPRAHGAHGRAVRQHGHPRVRHATRSTRRAGTAPRPPPASPAPSRASRTREHSSRSPFVEVAGLGAGAGVGRGAGPAPCPGDPASPGRRLLLLLGLRLQLGPGPLDLAGRSSAATGSSCGS